MRIAYTYIEGKNLLVQQYSGQPNIKQYAAYLEHLKQQPFYEDVFLLLTDLTQMDFEAVKASVESVTNTRNQKINKKFKEVLVVSSPSNTAFATLLKIAGSKNAQFALCSTFEKAITTLGIDLTKTEVEEILESKLKLV